MASATGATAKAINRGFSRRQVLRALGASASLGPFLPLLEREGAAQGQQYPTRLVLLFSSNGSLHEKWAPIGGSSTDFQLNEIHAPLERHKDKLVILDGLRIIGPPGGHQGGMAALWSGSPITDEPDAKGGGWGGSITVDQAVANQIGDQTPYKSLEFGVLSTFGQEGTTVFSRMCYRGARDPVSPVEDPAEMYRRLFSDIGVGDPRLERLQAERRSVLDLVKDDLSALSPKYSARDRDKLEAHLQAIRELELRNEAPLVVCKPPVGPEAGLRSDRNESLPEVSRAMIEQLVMALTCDLTRVASLQWCSSGSIERYGWLGLTEEGVTGEHHYVGHLADNDPNAVHYITTVQAYYASELSYMMDLMSQVPEGNGTLLDNTVIIWGNEMSRGNNHSNYPMPFLMAGGGGGKIQMGRSLDFGDTSHQRLLVSLSQIMGLDVDTFGNNDEGSGPLPGLLS